MRTGCAGTTCFRAARADLLRRCERPVEALAEYRRALELTGNDPERAFLRRRITELGG